MLEWLTNRLINAYNLKTNSMSKNRYSIAVIYNNFKVYYNFNNNSFDFDIFKNKRNKNHFISDMYSAKKIANKLHKLEQIKKYPFAKTIYLYENDLLINYINNN